MKRLLVQCLLLLMSLHVLAEKEKCMWIDAAANFKLFCNQDSIRYYLDRTRETGFNAVVLDVRPCDGRVLYKKTKRQPLLTEMGGVRQQGDWDYLEFFIDECHKRGMKVIVSTTFFSAGSQSYKIGQVYEQPRMAKYVSQEWTPDGMKDVRDDLEQVAVFLNPAHPAAQKNALEVVREIVSNYDIDGYALDYCRYGSIQSDFSDYSRKRFEKYIGHKVERFPQDIFTWEGKERRDGPLAQQWFDYRALVIHDFVVKVRKAIKRIKPQIDIHYWASSWYPWLYNTAQNWASQKYNPYGEHAFAGPNYYRSGFADQLDVFQLGAYLTEVYGLENTQSMEHAIARAKELLKDECRLYCSYFLLTMPRERIADATALCLQETDGLMVFDIVYAIRQNLWPELKEGIRRGEASVAP